jgi:hypothetical protein
LGPSLEVIGGQIDETTTFSQVFIYFACTHSLSSQGRRDNPAARDGGIHWEPQKGGTDKYLFGVHFADARPGWARSQRALGAAKRVLRI